MSQIFQKNIQALFEKNKELATKILTTNPYEKFEVVQQGDDPINLNIIDKEKSYPIYEKDFLSHLKTLQEEFKKYERYPFLFIYGIGNGIFQKLLFANPSHKKIFIIEPNIELLNIAFYIVDFSEEIKNDKIEFIDKITFSKAITIFGQKELKVYARTYHLHIHSPYYEKFFSYDIIETNKIFIKAIKHIITSSGNDTIDSLMGLEHHIKNLPTMLKNPYFAQLRNKPLSEWVIIVSTGPSLTKQLPLLKKIQDYVTIISVDASMPILEKENIIPDIVTSLERVKETAEFFKKTSKKFQEKFLTIHASLQHEDVLKNSYGPKMLVMRPFAQNIYFNLKKFGYLGIGMSAANMAYELAYVMGYKKIVLIGQDLAYSEDGKSHAKGHVYGEDEVKYKETDLYVTKYGGEGVIRTSRMWNIFKNFFERDIAHTKEEGIITINATEGGARIEGSIEKPFREVVKEIKKVKKKKLPKLKTLSQKEFEKSIIKSYKKAKEIINYGKKVQSKIEKVFLEVAKECEKLEKLAKENKVEKINFKRLEKLNKKIDKIKDIIETRKFALIFSEVVKPYLVSKENILAQISVRYVENDIEKKAKFIDWIMNHKEWLFVLAGIINAEVEVVKRSIGNLEKEAKKLLK